jgi:hypothetical protein
MLSSDPENYEMPDDDLTSAGNGREQAEAKEDLKATPERESRLLALWEGITQAGLANATLRMGTHILLIALILVVALVMREFYRYTQADTLAGEAALAAALPTATPTQPAPALPPFEPSPGVAGVSRSTLLHTTLPAQPRAEVTQYIVQAGDTLFGIAEKFGLKPETLLWGNQLVLGDNPHNLRPGQELNILPVDGTYYRWSAGDGLNGVSKFFGVNPEDIVNYPGNHLDPQTIGDFANPNIPPGTWLIVPGGTREFVTWSAPVIPRDNPGVAKVLGPGACGSIADGAVGAGAFIWPANNHFLSGFDYSPSTNHNGIDIDGNTGDAVYAVDNGVVVYAGWNNWGYGNVVVINHGNGWQTLYAHLSAYNVGCGQSVYQGNVIGAIGNTGNSSGSHLHYEMLYNGTKVNPWDYMP